MQRSVQPLQHDAAVVRMRRPIPRSLLRQHREKRSPHHRSRNTQKGYISIYQSLSLSITLTHSLNLFWLSSSSSQVAFHLSFNLHPSNVEFRFCIDHQSTFFQVVSASGMSIYHKCHQLLPVKHPLLPVMSKQSPSSSPQMKQLTARQRYNPL